MGDTARRHHREANGHVRSAPRRAIAALVVAFTAALAPDRAAAANRTFAANSLIIPLQIEYQPTDAAVLGAYGLAYTLLAKNAAWAAAHQTKPVTLHWIIAPNKKSQYRCDTNTATLPSYSTANDDDGCDFTVQNATAQPVVGIDASGAEVAHLLAYRTAYSSTTGPERGASYYMDATPLKRVVKYSGSALVVDATDRQNFLAMLAGVPELAQYHATASSGLYTAIHGARATFTAPVYRPLKEAPLRIAVTDTTHDSFLANVLANAGLTCSGVTATGICASQIYDLLDPSALLDPSGASPHGRLNDGTYGLFWGADGTTITGAQAASISWFLDRGRSFYAEATAISGVENVGGWQTTSGVSVVHPNISWSPACTDASAGTSVFHVDPNTNTNTNSPCLVYDGLNQPYAQTGNFAFDGGQGTYKAFDLASGSAFRSGVFTLLSTGGDIITSLRYKDDDTSKGVIVYLAGMRFDNGRFWGERMILNTVLASIPGVVGVEIARSEPVGYRDTSGATAVSKVYQGTYWQLPPPSEPDFDQYSAAFPQRWRFPWTTGHLYEFELASIATSSIGFAGTGASPKSWDAAERMPLPQDRTIFTALGGSAHLGWQRVAFDYRQTRSGCLDADGDHRCDLAQALAQCNTAGVSTDVLKRYDDASATQRDLLGMFLQQVRGHCAAHVAGAVVMEPTDAQCDSPATQDNRAKLGGIDHGSPAVVGPSRYVTGAAWVGRPVVAYVGARDGMLHAFYVSGGSGWRDPSGDGLPAGVRPGQELWAFIPPGQLCGGSTATSGLATNDAMVDASVNVIDVFGDFPQDVNGDGVIDWSAGSAERPTHVRQWRTVLLAAAGQGGSNLFAMDVTNPLKPVLLWHVGGEAERDGRWDVNDDGRFGAGEAMDLAVAKTYAFKWHDWDDGDAATAHIPTDYDTTSATVLDAIKTGRFDYRNLGLTYGTAIGKVWSGNAFQYVAYVATNAADYTSDAPLGYKGIEVFAIDVVTGQKLWQWERRYRRATPGGAVIADNTIPGRVALADVDADGSVDRIYVGDLEGHLWELGARDGRNLNYLDASDHHKHSFPLAASAPMTAAGADDATRDLYRVSSSALALQPLTSPIGQGRFTDVSDALRPYLLGRLAVVQGTMGTDWSIAPYEAGHLLVLPVSPEAGTRLSPPLDLTAARDPLLYGVLQSAATWDIALHTGERIFGMPRVVNNQIVFNTALGSFTGDITDTLGDGGNMVISSRSGTVNRSNDAKAFGGVLVFDGQVVITTASSIERMASPPAALSGGGISQQPFNRATPAILKSWEATASGR
jgi:type IV pilus assembly protein PilY1